MQKISVIIITFNEERNIARCIKSVEGVADEVIVVDSHSTDKTVEISEMLGAKVILQPFLGYAEQKNFANANASYDYILSLDADEALSPKLKAEILKIKAVLSAENVYEMNRKTNYCGTWINHTGWYPDRKIRLFHKQKAHWGGGALHEKLILENDIKCIRIDADIEHYSYYTLQGHILQIDKFTNISSMEMFEQGRKPSVIKILFSGPFRFLRDYIFKQGFLDGYAGYRIARMNAFSTFLKYAKAKELHDLNERKNS